MSEPPAGRLEEMVTTEGGLPTVKAVMATEIQWVVKGALVRSAATVMERFQIGSVLVSGDEGVPIGILTETDLVRRVIAADLHPWATRVEAVMTPSVVTVDEKRSVADAAGLMTGRAIRHLAVTRDGRVVGMLSARDLLGIETPSPALVEGAMMRLLATIHLHATVRDAAARMGEASVGALLVTGRRAKHRPGQLSAARQGDIAGVLTETDLVRKLVATDHYPYVTTVAQVMETPLRTLGAAVAATVGLQLALTYLPTFQVLFHTAPCSNAPSSWKRACPTASRSATISINGSGRRRSTRSSASMRSQRTSGLRG